MARDCAVGENLHMLGYLCSREGLHALKLGENRVGGRCFPAII